ncbi:MAG: hypothetical protein QOK29_5353, partial [Rhodospirillaceae bacterium]|nr:hypothetical protein [Rhodospirillaceae bacterium]
MGDASAGVGSTGVVAGLANVGLPRLPGLHRLRRTAWAAPPA